MSAGGYPWTDDRQPALLDEIQPSLRRLRPDAGVHRYVRRWGVAAARVGARLLSTGAVPAGLSG